MTVDDSEEDIRGALPTPEELRRQDIHAWWDAALLHDSLPYLAAHQRRPLKEAFKQVLGMLPDDDFDRFEAEDVTIVCLPVPALFFRIHVRSDRGHASVIYFDPHVLHYSPDKLRGTIAHEIAHVVLGHESDHTEADADALATRWGFPPPSDAAPLMKPTGPGGP